MDPSDTVEYKRRYRGPDLVLRPCFGCSALRISSASAIETSQYPRPSRALRGSTALQQTWRSSRVNVFGSSTAAPRICRGHVERPRTVGGPPKDAVVRSAPARRRAPRPVPADIVRHGWGECAKIAPRNAAISDSAEPATPSSGPGAEQSSGRICCDRFLARLSVMRTECFYPRRAGGSSRLFLEPPVPLDQFTQASRVGNSQPGSPCSRPAATPLSRPRRWIQPSPPKPGKMNAPTNSFAVESGQAGCVFWLGRRIPHEVHMGVREGSGRKHPRFPRPLLGDRLRVVHWHKCLHQFARCMAPGKNCRRRLAFQPFQCGA